MRSNKITTGNGGEHTQLGLSIRDRKMPGKRASISFQLKKSCIKNGKLTRSDAKEAGWTKQYKG